MHLPVGKAVGPGEGRVRESRFFGASDGLMSRKKLSLNSDIRSAVFGVSAAKKNSSDSRIHSNSPVSRQKLSVNSDIRSAMFGVSAAKKNSSESRIGCQIGSVRCEKNHQDLINANYSTLKSIGSPLKTNPPLLYMWGQAVVV